MELKYFLKNVYFKVGYCFVLKIDITYRGIGFGALFCFVDCFLGFGFETRKSLM